MKTRMNRGYRTDTCTDTCRPGAPHPCDPVSRCRQGREKTPEGVCDQCHCYPCCCSRATVPKVVIKEDDCYDPCPPPEPPPEPEPDPCRWDLQAEGFPVGVYGYRRCAFVDTAGILRPVLKSGNIPVAQYTYRSTVKDLGRICSGPLMIDLIITAVNYRQYIRTGNTQQDVLSAPFKLYTGQTVSARYVQYHLDVIV